MIFLMGGVDSGLRVYYVYAQQETFIYPIPGTLYFLTCYNVYMSKRDTPRDLELIAATAHELKTPLTIINGVGATLESESHGELNDQQREQIARIRSAGERMNALVNSMLHIENLPYTQYTRPVQLHSQLNSVLQEAEAAARKRNVTLTWRPRQTLPPVLADTASVYQLLTHTVTAVVKHAPGDSEVVLRTRCRAGMVVLRIDAPGEPARQEEVKRITETAGKQLQPVRGQGGSSGLNWYIVKSIMEFYEGSLNITPRSDHTVITIRLPMSNQLSLFS